jgi:hypothetical protein
VTLIPSRKVLLAFFSLSTIAVGQIGTASISGTVTDASGSVVAGVSVTATHVATGATHLATTNAAGFYTFPGLQIGAYTVSAEASGFKKTERTGIVLEVDDHPIVNLSLEVGTITESIEVQSSAAMVDASSATVGDVVSNAEILQLPLNGRNAMSLVELTPNARSNTSEPAGFADRGFVVSSFSVNGSPTGSNEMIIDGTTNVNPRQGDLNANLNADEVQEFKVQSGVMSAEYNFTLGGVINMVTKSGTNGVHGTLYEFLRNADLDSKDFFAVSVPALVYNQYGGTVGGPIKKDKLFYFGNLEQYNYSYGTPIVASTPTALEREGNFSKFDTASGSLITMYDPATTSPTATGYSRTPFPGNIIPASRLNPMAATVMTFYPLPNATPSNAFTQDNNYDINAPAYQTQRQELVKIDYLLSAKDTLSGRYILNDSKSNNGGSAIFPNPDFDYRYDNYSDRNVNLSETHTFSPTVINQFYFGLLRNWFPSMSSTENIGLGAEIGWPPNEPFITAPTFTGLTPFTTWAGSRVSGGFLAMVTGQLRDSITWIKGQHTLKIGVEYRLSRYFDDECQICTCQCAFTSALTGNPNAPSGTGTGLASFLLGDVASATIQVESGASYHNYTQGYYIQDDWKVSPHLTLNTGLRWDYQQPPWEAHDGGSTFNPHLIDNVDGVQLQGAMQYQVSGPDGFGKYMFTPDYKNWAPRFGFAYSPFANNKTVFRGGYGIYYAYTMPFADNLGSLGFHNNTTTYNPPGNNTEYPAFILGQSFPTPPIQPLGAALGPALDLGSAVSMDEPNGRTPYIQEFTFTIQHELPKGWLAEAGFSGSKGTHLRAGSYNLDQMNPQYLSLGNALNSEVPNPYAGIVPGPLGNPTITLQQALSPYPYYSQVLDQDTHLGSSDYEALILSLEKRFTSGLVLLSSYTFSKSISDGVAGEAFNGGTLQVQAPTNSTTTGEVYQDGLYDLRASRSIDSDDTPYRWVTSLVYELPVGTGKRWNPSDKFVKTLVGGWELNSVISFEGGLPLLISGANNFVATRPNSTGQGAKLANPTVQEWFNTQVFVNPPDWTFGNVGPVLPNARTPGVNNVDFSVAKTTTIHERWQLQIRGEAFNALNHPNFLPPNTTFVPGTNGLNSSSTFGEITSDRGPRVLQVAMKLIF